MPGMLRPEQVVSLRGLAGAAFDPLFVELMTFHHRGAIAMADEAVGRAGDPRLKLISYNIRHEQRGEIELMHGSQGIRAVRAAVASLFAQAGQAPADRSDGTAAHPGHPQ
jgi:hypothetical protein